MESERNDGRCTMVGRPPSQGRCILQEGHEGPHDCTIQRPRGITASYVVMDEDVLFDKTMDDREG